MLNQSLSFLVKCSQTGTVWLFNCPEGCQHILISQKIKIHLITHIVITHLSIDNIAGLMGLLSSLSLSSRINTINIYGPPGLFQYLQLARKYSQTTFKYSLSIYVIKSTHTSNYVYSTVHSYPKDAKNSKIEYTIIEKEKIGRFKSQKAKIFKITPGPIFGQLKAQGRLLTPCGTIVSGKYFTNPYSAGFKIIYLIEKYGSRSSSEVLHL